MRVAPIVAFALSVNIVAACVRSVAECDRRRTEAADGRPYRGAGGWENWLYTSYVCIV